jgi:hypothetical protein
MSDASVSIELSFITKRAKEALNSVKSSISSIGGSSFSDLASSVKTSMGAFKSWSFTVKDAVDKSVDTFYRLKNTLGIIKNIDLHNLADVFDDAIYNAVDHTINAFYKLKTAMQQIKGAASTIGSSFKSISLKSVIWEATKAFRSFKDSVASFKIRPGILVTPFATMLRATQALAKGLFSLGRSAVPLAGAALKKLGSAAIAAGSGFLRAVTSVKNFVFSLKGLAAAAGVGAGIAAIFKMSEVADQLEVAQWKFNTVFNEVTEKANAAAKEIADTFKVNIGSIQSQMSRAADVVKPLGLDQEKILEMTKTIGLLAQSAEKWTEGRYDAERASTAMMKALTGEKEMLKEFGVVMRDNDIFDSIQKIWGKDLSDVNKSIETYNFLLERTKDMQKSTFDRLEMYGERMKQFKESIKTLAGAIGNFFKPITTEILYLGGVINRKLSEWLGTEGFKSWKQLSEDIAEAIKDIASVLEGIDATKITDQFEKLKSMLKDVAAAVGQFFADTFMAVFERIAPIIGEKIKSAVRVGIDLATDISGQKKEKALAIRAQSQDPNWLLYGEEGFWGEMDRKVAIGMNERLTGYRPGEKVSKSDLDWAEKFLGAEGPEVAGESLGEQIGRYAKGMAKRIKDTTDEFRKETGGGATGIVSRPSYSTKRMELEGPDKAISEKDRLAWDRIGLRIEGFQNRIADLGERQGTGTTASLQGLTDAYTSMLTRASGKTNAAEKSAKELEMLNAKTELARREQSALLERIAENTGKTPAQVKHAFQ